MRRTLPVFARAESKPFQYAPRDPTRIQPTNDDDPNLPPFLRNSDFLIKIPELTPEQLKEVEKIESDPNYFNTPEWLAKIPPRETAECVPPDTRILYRDFKGDFDKDPELLAFHKKSADFHNRRDAIVNSLRSTGSVYSYLKDAPGFPQQMTEQDKENLHKLDERLTLFFEEEIAKTPPRNDYKDISLETQQRNRLYAHYFMLSVVFLLPLWRYQSYKRSKKAKQEQGQ